MLLGPRLTTTLKLLLGALPLPGPLHLRLGRSAEHLAAKHLRQAGYRILAVNLRCPLGEIDVVALAPDRRTIVVVEVKASAAAGPQFLPGRDGATAPAAPPVEDNASQPLPEVRVNLQKQRKLSAMASWLVRRHRLAAHPIRFDVVGVNLPSGQPAAIRHYEAAFESTL